MRKQIQVSDIEVENHHGEFHASFTMAFTWKNEFKGCPMGVGVTPTDAREDLIVRTNRESGTEYFLNYQTLCAKD